MTWTLGVDVGGTFTDVHAVDAASGESRVLKLPSTPHNPALAIVEGVRRLLAGGVEAPQVARLAHGTTVATNALIERRGAPVAVVTTEGFRDLLEIGRQTRPRLYDFQADHPPPLAPRERRFEVAERIGPAGEVVRALDDEALERVAAEVRASGAASCAVCLLFSFLNPVHERAVGRALRRAMPELHVSLSSEVQPEFREYERFSTTLLNAWLQPAFGAYLDSLEQEVAALLPHARLGINQSSGGLMSASRARAFPVRSALSGPAAGVVGAVAAAREAGVPDVITLDMGGTSADVCLVRGHRAGIGSSRTVAEFPIRMPMVDVHTVGAGGGSIAWFDRDGLLKVGPASAGADPGPACYGHGGTAATVTDANLVLGRLSAGGLLGGGMPLDEAAARAAVGAVAARLGFDLERTARGILDIVDATMVRAIRAVSVERGHDPRECALLAYGGAGPLHASAVARELGMRRVLVPPSPGILCARGLVVADLAEERVRSRRVALDGGGVEALGNELEALWRQAEAWFEHEQVPPRRRAADLVLDLRYVGQNFELRVKVASVTGARPALPAPQRIEALFEQAHEAVYGFASPGDAVEAVNLRLALRGEQDPPPASPAAEHARGAPPAAHRRAVHFAGPGTVDAPVYAREALLPGHRFEGPAVVEQLDATTVIGPGEQARVDAAGNLLLML